MRFVWLVFGLVAGVAVGRNKGDIPTPFFGALVFVALVVLFLAYRAGNRDRASAVAVAVASAEARAEAHLQAMLAAQAHATGGNVQLVLPNGQTLPLAGGEVVQDERLAELDEHAGQLAGQLGAATAWGRHRRPLPRKVLL